MAKTLDITGFSRVTESLHDDICKAVLDTQAILMTELPDTIEMREDQFDALNKDEDMQFMYGSKDMMYRTPLNIMEVRVKNGVSAIEFITE